MNSKPSNKEKLMLDQQAKNYLEEYLHWDFNRLISAILFICQKSSASLNKISLCKMLYYADGSFYGQHKRTITQIDYLHAEAAPQPMFWNETLQKMIDAKQIEIIPDIQQKITAEGKVTVMAGILYKPLQDSFYNFSQEEQKTLEMIVKTFNGDMSLETRYFSDLYQHYTQTGVYQKIGWQLLSPPKTQQNLKHKGWNFNIFRLWGK